ncbi:MAG: transglycosylase SLT domain-containing protein [Deltaproteobacteria bacterium]|nr:transglycosylase SLT domain-containing protein [Deltaproteobacteria bacterium]
MILRHYVLGSLFLLSLALNLSCTPIVPEGVVSEPTKIQKVQLDKISAAVVESNWNQALKLSSGHTNPLARLVNIRALYELKRYDEVLGAKSISDKRFAPYDLFLRGLSAFEAKRWDQLLDIKVRSDLPRPLRERLEFFQATALYEKKELEEAKTAFEKFLRTYRASGFESEVLFRLADIEWSLGNQKEGLEVYERIYKFHPLDDAEDLAKQQLQNGGRFDTIDTDTHISRIQKLQRAALFGRAEAELADLRERSSPEQQNRLDFAMAQILFGQRKYSQSEKLARKKLEDKDLDSNSQIQWQELLASSLIRQGQTEEGQGAFEDLLKKDISPQLRETILYRLGSIAVDYDEFASAQKYFKELQNSFGNGRYVESAHWFDAWASYRELQTEPKRASKKNYRGILKTLEAIPNLPDSRNFTPQSFYWQHKIAQIIRDKKLSDEMTQNLSKDWNISFYSLLIKENPFSFLNAHKLKTNPPRIKKSDGINESFRRELSWQRLEAFRSVGLLVWGKMELDIFLANSRKFDPTLSKEVAERLASVEDWYDLLKWADQNFDRPQRLSQKDESLLFYFPLAYKDIVQKAAKEFHVSPFLIWGIMREESRFEVDVVSRAGAMGLMQLLPSLAQNLSRDLSDSSFSKPSLADPRKNIRYGAYYLHQLQKQMNKFKVSDELKTVLMIASYNAGVDAVSKWVKDKDTSQVDVFVESISFLETRQYVKRVLQSAYTYYQLYGDHDEEVARTKSEINL